MLTCMRRWCCRIAVDLGRAFINPLDLSVRDRVVGIVRIGLSIEPAQERLRQVLFFSVGLGVFDDAGGGAALFIAGRLSGRSGGTGRGADEIRSGNLHPRISVRRSDELGLWPIVCPHGRTAAREHAGAFAAQSQLGKRDQETDQATAPGLCVYVGPKLSDRSQRRRDGCGGSDRYAGSSVGSARRSDRNTRWRVFLLEDGATGEPEFLVRAAYSGLDAQTGTATIGAGVFNQLQQRRLRR